jgi:AhpD family alkylhydroperoxidase
MGFVPSSFFAMAHWPELLQHFMALAGTVLNSGDVDPGLKQMVAYVTSHAAGCRYCQAHTSHSAVKRGISAEKMARTFEFDQSNLFSDSENAALRVALHGGTVPNGVEAEHMKVLQQHFGAGGVVEIVAVISLFGFLNRWNDTMATSFEPVAQGFASQTLLSAGWQIGKHGGDT